MLEEEKIEEILNLISKLTLDGTGRSTVRKRDANGVRSYFRAERNEWETTITVELATPNA